MTTSRLCERSTARCRRRLDRWAERFGRCVYERSWGHPPDPRLDPAWARRHFTRFGYQAAAVRAGCVTGAIVLVLVLVLAVVA